MKICYVLVKCKMLGVLRRDEEGLFVYALVTFFMVEGIGFGRLGC